MIITIGKVYRSGDKYVGHKPTTFGVARDKSGRKDGDCLYLYPGPDTPNQTSLFLS